MSSKCKMKYNKLVMFHNQCGASESADIINKRRNTEEVDLSPPELQRKMDHGSGNKPRIIIKTNVICSYHVLQDPSYLNINAPMFTLSFSSSKRPFYDPTNPILNLNAYLFTNLIYATYISIRSSKATPLTKYA